MYPSVARVTADGSLSGFNGFPAAFTIVFACILIWFDYSLHTKQMFPLFLVDLVNASFGRHNHSGISNIVDVIHL